MNCIYCGKPLPDDSEFCAYCGKVVEKDLTPRCRACGRQVSEDAFFCSYCGTTLQPARKDNLIQSASTTTYVPIKKSNTEVTRADHRTKKSKKHIIFAAVVLVVLLAMLALQPVDAPPSSSSHNNTSTPSLTPVWEPTSGSVLENYGGQCNSSLTVRASSGSACVVRVKYHTGNTALSFYVRAGETATVDVPATFLQIFFASGDTWYGFDNLFGPDTQYSKDDDVLDFSAYTYEYTLYPVTNGNFSQTPIDASAF